MNIINGDTTWRSIIRIKYFLPRGGEISFTLLRPEGKPLKETLALELHLGIRCRFWWVKMYRTRQEHPSWKGQGRHRRGWQGEGPRGVRVCSLACLGLRDRPSGVRLARSIYGLVWHWGRMPYLDL